MSMADIIMQGTARGLASRSRGMAQLGAGIAGGLRNLKDERVRQEESKREEERWGTKKKFMNAQAEQQIQATKAAKKKYTEATNLAANLDTASTGGKDGGPMTTSETFDHLVTNGSSGQADVWLQERLAGEADMQSSEINKINMAEGRLDVLQEALGNAGTDEEIARGIQFASSQLDVDITRGLEGTPQEKLKTIMGPLGTVRDKIALNRTTIKKKTMTDLEKDLSALKRAKESGDETAVAAHKAVVQAGVNKIASQAGAAELNLINAQIKQDGLVAKRSVSLLRDHLQLDDEEILPENAAEITAQMNKMIRKGLPVEETKRWMKDFVVLKDAKEEGFFSRLFSQVSDYISDPPPSLEISNLPDEAQYRNDSVDIDYTEQQVKTREMREFSSASSTRGELSGSSSGFGTFDEDTGKEKASDAISPIGLKIRDELSKLFSDSGSPEDAYEYKMVNGKRMRRKK